MGRLVLLQRGLLRLRQDGRLRDARHAATGGFVWMLIEYFHKGKATVLSIVRSLPPLTAHRCGPCLPPVPPPPDDAPWPVARRCGAAAQ